MLDTSFCFRPPFLSFFTSSEERFHLFSLSGSPLLCPVLLLLLDAQPGSIVFLIDPTPYRVLCCNPISDSLMVFPAMGSKKSVFFATKSTVWTPPKNFQSLAINTEPMHCELPLSPSSPLTPLVLPDIADFGMMTAPNQTSPSLATQTASKTLNLPPF